MLQGDVGRKLEEILIEIASEKGLEVVAVEVMPDHVHLFINAPPQHAPSLLINWFKGISSRLYNHRFKGDRIRWTNAYYIGTAGSVSKETIQKYIEEQTNIRDRHPQD